MAQREPGKQTQSKDGLPRNEAHGSLEDGRTHYWRLVNFECGLAPLSPKVKFLLSQTAEKYCSVLEESSLL